MKKDFLKTSIISLLIILAVFSRLIPHYPNFTALGAVAIFGGVALTQRWIAFALPLVAMWISDLVLNNLIYNSSPNFIWFSQGFIWIYLGVAAHTLITWLTTKKPSIATISAVAFWGALVFFILSNFGVWLGSGMYPKTSEGLIACYVAAIPFGSILLLSNLFFSALLFGVYYLLEKRTSVFQAA